MASSKRLRLAIGLPARNQAELTKLLQELYDPGSPNYRHYLTPAQFAERFGPAESDYAAVARFAGAHGLAVTGTHPNRLVLDVEGAVPDIEKALHVTMRTYRHPLEPREYYAPDTEPSLDLAVPVLHIDGLDNYSLPHPNHKLQPALARSGVAPNTGSGPSGSYAGGDFRAAYAPGTTQTGSGQCVGLLQYDGYYASDITAYETQFGLPNVPLVNVAVDGGNTTPGTGNSEVCLDIEMVISMAPGISTIYVYEAPNNTGYWSDLLSKMANDNLAKQLSCSWGGGGPNPTCETIFQQMAAQGQSFFNATGDSDAFTAAIPFPSDSPNITEVGATTLTTSGAGGSYVSETVWNWNNGTGSSGGTSTYYAIPAWQQGVSMLNNQGSSAYRNVPDVALAGDQIYVLYNNGGTGTFGGTSCAAPLWAAFTALVNQQCAANGRPTVGFLNPTLYGIGQSANYSQDFHDVTSGNNFSTSSTTKYSAVAGYDLCTGWGTPNCPALLQVLSDPLTVTGSSYNTSGFTGGPFSPASSSYALANSGTAPLTWTASATQSWLTLSSSGGSLAVGGSTTVLASINANANALASGTYSDSVAFTDTTSGVGQSRSATLVVKPPVATMSVSPSTAFAPSGIAGGPFIPASGTYTVINVGAGPMTWSVSNTSSWLSVSPTGGTLAVGGSASVLTTVTAAANNFVTGTFTDTLSFTNLTNGLGSTAVSCKLIVTPDYFTQMFASGSNNTAYHSFTFTPNGSVNYYLAHCDGTNAFPTSLSSGSNTKLTLTDDSYATATLTGTARVYLYGTAYSTFYVGSNGFITFGSGDTTWSQSISAHFNRARISGLFRDLNPGVSGTISWMQLSDRAAVTYQSVPAYGTSSYNSFQIEMFFDGRIRITVLSLGSTDGIIGLSKGGGTPTGFQNSAFTSYSPTPRSNADLSALALSSGTLSPAFTAGGTSYSVSVPYNVTTESVTPTLSDTAATMLVAGGTNLALGSNSITIRVTAQDTVTVKTYTLLVTRLLNSDATLSALALSSGTLSPAFSANTTGYTAAVPNNVTAVTVAPTLSDTAATVQVTGGTNLAVGSNTITVKVTAQDTVTVKTYTVAITRLPSSNASLSALVLSAGTLNPAFNAAITGYTATVPNSVTGISVTPTLADSTATITSITGTSGFAVGPNNITVTVTAQDGVTTMLYTVVVTRLPSSNATLSRLALSSGTLSPVFLSSGTNYAAAVPNAVTSESVTATLSDSTATITGITGTSGFAVGSNTITIAVTAQDGVTTMLYRVVVTRLPSSNATLSRLALSSGTLTPVFSSSGTNYTATVPNGITGETVTATLSDSTATITGITGTSGFAVGANTITVAVTAQDGVTTMLYTVVVTCLPSSNATLSSLALSSGTLTPIFSSSGTNYTSTVPNEITGETVTVALSDSTATLTAITGTSGFAVGANTISVTVTAQDGITSLAYSIVVTRLPGNYTVSLAGNPICGQLNGGGAYSPGTDTTVTAIPNKAYRFVCWTENGNPVSTSTNYTFTMNGDRILTATFQAQTYSAWAASTFTATQLADSSVSGAPATPAGDGIPNLLKYAFNCNSLFPSRTVLPSVSVEGGFVTLTYVINSAATDLTFIAEVSGDMVTWNSGAAYTTAPALVTQDDQTQTLKASDLIPASTGQGRFIRLRLLGP